jgi:hypothetical protein
MSRIVLVVAIVAVAGGVASAQIAPAVDVAPTARGDLPSQPAMRRPRPVEAERRPWLPTLFQPTAASPPARFSKTDRVVAIAAGAFLGFWGGARLGYAVTANDRDDTSGLRGVVVGAPVGAVVGALVGFRLTK